MRNEKESNRRYRASAVHGDLAYDLDYAEREYRLRHAGELREEEKKEPYMRPAVKAQAQPLRRARPEAKRRPMGAVLLALSAAAIAGVLLLTILGYVQLSQLSNSVVEMKDQLSELQQENVDLTTKYELTFDLATVKTQAEAAGMSKPSSSQTYYMDLSGDDAAVVYSADSGGLEQILASLKQTVCSVVEYFH